MIYLLVALLSFNSFAELTQKQVEDNLKQCGYKSSAEFITDRSAACVDITAWDYCPDTGVRHFNGMCDTMSQEQFLQVHEEI